MLASQFQAVDSSLDKLISELDFLGGETSKQRPVRVYASPASTTMDSDYCEVEDDSKGTRGTNKKLPKADYAVDHLDTTKLHAFIQPQQVEQKNSFPCNLETVFKKKYFRFDNKSLQCFPGCSRFADVREARMMALDHKGGGRGESFCTNAVEGSVMVLPLIPTSNVIVIGRFLSATPEVSVLPQSETALLDVGTVVTTLPEKNCVRGTAVEKSSPSQVDQWGRRAVHLIVQAQEAWFMDVTLPRHRRNAACAAHKVPLFVFEMLVFLQQGPSSFQLCARAVSSPFEVASIRTLIREVLAFRRQNLPSNASAAEKEMLEEEEEDKPAPAIKPMSARRQMAAGYSSAVQRIRVAEATKKEEQKKKRVEMIVEVVPETNNSDQMDVVMFPTMPLPSQPLHVPLQEISFDIPELMEPFEFPADPFFQAPEFNIMMNVVANDLDFEDIP